ncbi:MAG: extracellular solute-binding protein [Patescibacteria group bacterium]|jgi:ABC-type glycerol-3-phosphate transport system substrate-binding protein
MRKSTIVLFAIALPVLIIVGLVIFSGGGSVPPPATTTLTVWGFTSQANMQNILTTFHAQSPYVNVTYVQVEKEGLREKLLEQWALGKGPDVVMIPSEQLVKYQPFLSPAPSTIPQYTYTTTKTLGIKEETTITKTNAAGPTTDMLRQTFIDTVANDASIGQKVYGMPLSIDSLVLFSNRDLLNQAQIALPATTWEQFIQHVARLTIVDAQGNLIQSGTALGTSTNIKHATDILALILMQNGSKIVDPSTGKVLLANDSSAVQAINFYTDFARASKVVYSWNDAQENALNAFAAGKVAYYIGFSEDDTTIKQRAVGLNYDITAVPQISTQQTVNIASYDVLSVAKSSTNQDTAWNFITFATSKNSAALYANESFQTPTRKDLLNELINTQGTTLYGVLAGQALTAHNWYRGPDSEKAQLIMSDLITTTLGGTQTTNAINAAIQQLRLIQT